MKQSTVKLVLVTGVFYFTLLFLVRGLFPADFGLPLYVLAPPLLLVVLVLVSDLSGRATVPTKPHLRGGRGSRVSGGIQQLTRQIEVGAMSSKSYYEDLLLARLQEVLLDKVSLETGLDRKTVQEILRQKTLGPGLLRDRELYRLLYSGAPSRGSGRIKLLEQAVAAIEAWKP